MTQLKDDLLNWVISESRHLEFSEVLGIESLREQASLRSYFRIITDIGTKVGVISDPHSNINNLFHKLQLSDKETRILASIISKLYKKN